MKKLLLSMVGAALLLGAGGCAVPLSDAPGTPGTEINLSELENDVGGADPIEGANRVMFAVTDFCMDYIVDFIGRIYCTILPRPVIDAIDNAGLNLEFPARVISCLLSAEWRGAGHETVRVFANSIIGICGFFDVAAPWWGFYSTESNFGQAFATWGIDPGCTLTLPFSRATNVRDTVGLLFDTIFDAKSYIPYCGYVTTINRLVVGHRDYIQLVEGSGDRYKSFRQLMLVYREIRQRKLVYHARNAAYEEKQQAKREQKEREEAAAKGEPLPPPPAPPELPVPPRPEGLVGEWLAIPEFGAETTPAQQSLLSLHFRPRGDDDFWYYRLSFFNHDFVRAASRRRLAAQPGRERPRYYFWKQPEPDPESPPRREKLALILPGIGGAWDAPTALALAEMFYREGYDVANFDSAFHWYFMASSGAHLRLPGFLPEDAAAVKILLRDALEDLRERGDVKEPYTVLVGYSMGGMHALKIAATDRAENSLKLDRVLAINPPAELCHALKRAEEFARQGGRYSVREAVDRIVTVGGSLLAARAGDEDVLSSRLVLLPPLGAEGAPPVERYLPKLDAADAECLVGMNLGTALREVLLTAHRERGLRELETPFAVLKRNELYREIDAIGFSCYAEKILAGEYPGVPLEELYRMSSLRSFENRLAADPRLRVLHSWNDPLLTGDDARYLDRLFGKRIVWSSGGGHLGDLCADAVQKRIIELAAPPEEPKPSPEAAAGSRSAAPAEPPPAAERPAPISTPAGSSGAGK